MPTQLSNQTLSRNVQYPQELLGIENEYENIMAISVIEVLPQTFDGTVTPRGNELPVDGETASVSRTTSIANTQSSVNAQRRIQHETIYLPAPFNMNFSSSHSWEGTDVGVFRTFRDGDTSDSFLDKIKNHGSRFAGDIANSSGRGIASIGSNQLRDAQDAARRKVSSPHLEVLYREPNLRTFNFSFRMSPLEEADCDSIYDLIRILRRSSSPENFVGNTEVFDADNRVRSTAERGQQFSASDNYFIMPSEFKLRFLLKDPNGDIIENPFIPKVKNCVMNTITVNYSTLGNFASYKNGFPAELEMNLDFTETELIMRDDVLAGF